MSKIVQAVNSMITNKEKITDVGQKKNELFFSYNGKYRWSMKYDADSEDYWLYYYKTTLSIDELVALVSLEFYSGVELVYYRAKDIGTKEAFSTFRDLFQILKEKVLGVEEVLDDIIGNDVPF